MKIKFGYLCVVFLCVALLGGCGKQQYVYVGNVIDEEGLQSYGGHESEDELQQEYANIVQNFRNDMSIVVDEIINSNITYDEENNLFIGIPGVDGAKKANENRWLTIEKSGPTDSDFEYDYSISLKFEEMATGDVPDKLKSLLDMKKIKENTIKYIDVKISLFEEIDSWEEVDEWELLFKELGCLDSSGKEYDGISEVEIYYKFFSDYYFVMY